MCPIIRVIIKMNVSHEAPHSRPSKLYQKHSIKSPNGKSHSLARARGRRYKRCRLRQNPNPTIEQKYRVIEDRRISSNYVVALSRDHNNKSQRSTTPFIWTGHKLRVRGHVERPRPP